MDEINISNMIIDRIPFYYKSHFDNRNGNQPHVLPFSLNFDENLKLVYQKSTPQLDKILNEVYLEGSLVDGSISSESGQHYLIPVINFISKYGNLNSNSKILEIGFGEGLFLKKLKEIGFTNLFGVEPGNHTFCTGLDDIELISDFFPTTKFNEKVDLIFHTLVLEHIQNPIDFLIAQRNQLTDNGKIIVFVPNEEVFLNEGDCSSFIHEHFNYFTRESLKNVALSAGLFIEHVEILGGLIALVLTTSRKDTLNEFYSNNFNFDIYQDNLNNNLLKVKSFLSNVNDVSNLALYVPARSLNLMYLADNDSSRLIDDNSEIHNKFLPFFKNSVETFEMLLSKPPSEIVIFSKTFGEVIKKKCINQIMLNNINILTYNDLVS